MSPRRKMCYEPPNQIWMFKWLKKSPSTKKLGLKIMGNPWVFSTLGCIQTKSGGPEKCRRIVWWCECHLINITGVASSCVLNSSPRSWMQSIAGRCWKTAPLHDWLPQRNTAGCGKKVELISTFFWAAAVAQTATGKTDRPHSVVWENLHRRITWFRLNTA